MAEPQMTKEQNSDREVPMTAEDRRQAELNAGRQRFEERADAAGIDKADRQKMLKRGDDENKESEEFRKTVYTTETLADKSERDRAGAEIIDQAQTELEAVQHLADRNEPIIDMRRETIIEKLKGDADPEAAREITTDLVTAQAVNQPTVLANNRGQETHDRPLNTTLGPGGAEYPDAALTLERQITPADKHVPKDRKQAEKVAKGKVPDTKKVVKQAAVVSDQDPSKNEAVDIVRAAPDDILGDGSK